MSLIKYDEKVARSIYDQLNCTGLTENAVFPKERENENYRPKTLIDETLEYIDPTPNIFTLFVQFNEKFFWNKLLPVQVKWSPRMTSCAGICSFHPKNRECIISLSTPLLKLRPRKDLIETLLHEMIHAYLFLTNDNRDRDGHGPVFKSHMKRINNIAGTNITIYHTFHEEVKLYQQHWWRCNGPCQKRAPFFGMVRRAMNRAPGQNDFWWKEHQLTCGGQFIKVKEPEKPEPRNKKNNSKTTTGSVTKTPENNAILNWVKKNQNNTTNVQGKNVPEKSNKSQITNSSNTKSNSVPNFQTDFKKLGNSTNNVHGWGTGGPSSSCNSSNTSNKIPSNNFSNNSNPRLSFSGTLGGSGTGKSILLDKFVNTGTINVSSKGASLVQPHLNKANLVKKPTTIINTNDILENLTINTVTCPNCNKSVDESKINQHLDICLENATDQSENSLISSNKKRKSEDSYLTSSKIFKDDNKAIPNKKVECPLCRKKLNPENFNEHLEICLQNDLDEKIEDDVSILDSSSSSVNLHDSPHVCLICDKVLKPNTSLNDHLEECVASVFNDSDNEGDNSFHDEEQKADEKQDLENYPCPVCMALVKPSLMNDHLDTCLTKTE